MAERQRLAIAGGFGRALRELASLGVVAIRAFIVAAVAVWCVVSISSATAASAASTDQDHGYGASTYTYDTALHSVQANTSGVAPVVSLGVSEGVRGTVGTVIGPLTVVLRLSVAADSVGDSAIVVRGGASEVPAAGEAFSGAYGSTVEEAAAGVPHGQVRVATAGDIRAGGGTVEYAPEWNPNVGQTNFQHVNVCLGAGSCPFGELMPNPVPKPWRFGGPAYPYGIWETNNG